MPLRFIKVPKKSSIRLDPSDVLQVGVTVTALTKELATISVFPPAIAAVSIVLVILETLQV